MQLNDEQKKAVYALDRFIFLLAGAGTGKTRVVVEKIKYLIQQNVSNKEILAITFTKKAAKEMKERLPNEGVEIHTFHGLCYQYLKDCIYLKFDMLNESFLPFRKDELLQISIYKNSLRKTKKPNIYDSYQHYLEKNNLKDFDDLLIETLKHIQLNKNHLKFKYIFVDEFQDTNPLQFTLLQNMLHESTSLFAVGDPDQSIYRFRGASPKIIEIYEKTFHAKRYQLVKNYRSSPPIVAIANHLIHTQQTFKKKLIATLNTNGHCYSIHFDNLKQETKYVIQLIQFLKKKHGRYEKIAILYRHHLRVSFLITQLHDIDIPFQIEDGCQEDDQGIHLLSIHQAKGLEFEAVILLGLEKQQLPSYHMDSKKELEEERRLFFVAITRAKIDLYTTVTGVSSPFLLESRLKSIHAHQLDDIISIGD